MADTFYPRQKDYIYHLNLMADAFNRGPYNALPLTGGNLTGPVTSTSTLTLASTGVNGIVEQVVLATNGSGDSGTAIRFGYPGGVVYYGSRIVGGGNSAARFAGYTAFQTGTGTAWKEVARITEDGKLLIGTPVTIGPVQPTELLQVAGQMRVTTPSNAGGYVMAAGRVDLNAAIAVYAGDGTPFTQPNAVLFITKDSGTSRSVSATGTVNTSGNDYAEYMFKTAWCGMIAKGQIVGVTKDNLITDRWDEAVLFCIKSTDPSFVGGDIWSNTVGPRPEMTAGAEPQLMGDSAEALATYKSAMAVYEAARKADEKNVADHEVALEVERQKVDRIAIAGRVPVNVYGAKAGDYIIPVKDGDGIKGIAVAEDDMTLKQYLRAVGQVIMIEEDGRAYVMVKSV